MFPFLTVPGLEVVGSIQVFLKKRGVISGIEAYLKPIYCTRSWQDSNTESSDQGESSAVYESLLIPF